MQSLFHSPYFGLRGLDNYRPIILGQDIADLTGLTSDVEGLLKQLPPELLGTYNAKFQACAEKISGGNIADTAVGVKCLRDLYKEIEDVLKNGPKVVAPLPAAPAPFPVLPVAIGVVGVGVLIYGLSRLF